MVEVRALLDYLRKKIEVDEIIGPKSTPKRLRISNVNLDRKSTPGEIAWVSKRAMMEDPSRIDGFKGSVLLCPIEANPTAMPGCWFVRCPNPKMAIILVINRFFAHLSETRLPRHGEISVAPDAEVEKTAEISYGAVIGGGVRIGPRAHVGPNTVISHCEIGAGTRIGANCTIGLPGFGYEKGIHGELVRFPHIGNVIIETNVEIGSNVCIDRGSIGNTVIRTGARVDNLVHVAHNVDIGQNALVIANSMLGGSVTIGNNAWIAPSAAIMNQAIIGRDSIVGLGAVVLKDVDAGSTVVGNPAYPLKK